VCVHCEVRLEQAKISLQIDVGFGDTVTPRAIEVQYPTILAFPAPVLPAYQRETVVAEKFQAMVALGIANSRMKDFFDLWILARGFAFDGPRICRAIQATFRRRKTDLPSAPPIALTSEFGTDAMKTKQWQAFVKKGKLDVAGATLEQICEFLQGFLLPPTRALLAGVEFKHAWPPAGPWETER
jgi:hypothetical protein